LDAKVSSGNGEEETHTIDVKNTHNAIHFIHDIQHFSSVSLAASERVLEPTHQESEVIPRRWHLIPEALDRKTDKSVERPPSLGHQVPAIDHAVLHTLHPLCPPARGILRYPSHLGSFGKIRNVILSKVFPHVGRIVKKNIYVH